MWKAGYNLEDNMMLEVFTNGLPMGLYKKIFTIDEPTSMKGGIDPSYESRKSSSTSKPERKPLNKIMEPKNQLPDPTGRRAKTQTQLTQHQEEPGPSCHSLTTLLKHNHHTCHEGGLVQKGTCLR